MNERVGIYSIGTFLPKTIRDNSYWPPIVQRDWQKQLEREIKVFRSDAQRLGDGARLAVEAITETAKDDPFQGFVHRRVMPDEMRTSEMETAAAREAIERAGIDPIEIGLVVSHSVCPDFLNTANACFVHLNLGLTPRCVCISLDGSMCNSFLLELELANQMILAGRTKYALLVQSSGLTRFATRDQIFSPSFGDGAAAVVVGRVDREYGILGQSTHINGNLSKAFVMGVPYKPWHEGGRVVAYVEDPVASIRMLLSAPELGRQVVHEALDEAGLETENVDFYASHQSTVWFRRVSQSYIGLSRAKAVDTSSWAGTICGANIPLALATAQQEGTLKDGDVVAMYTPGGGHYSGAIMRWGTGGRVTQARADHQEHAGG